MVFFDLCTLFEVHINRVKPASFFGPTTLATPSYTIIALTFAQQGVDKSNTTKPFWREHSSPVRHPCVCVYVWFLPISILFKGVTMSILHDPQWSTPYIKAPGPLADPHGSCRCFFDDLQRSSLHCTNDIDQISSNRDSPWLSRWSSCRCYRCYRWSLLQWAHHRLLDCCLLFSQASGSNSGSSSRGFSFSITSTCAGKSTCCGIQLQKPTDLRKGSFPFSCYTLHLSCLAWALCSANRRNDVR